MIQLRFTFRVLVIAVAAVIASRFIHWDTSVQDPGGLADALVDAGVSFSAGPADAALLEERKIVLATDVNAASMQRLMASLLLLDARDPTRPVDLYIRTEGGWISDAFGVIDIMRTMSAPVNTHAVGGTHSAGAMILAAGTGTRCAYPSSTIMFHGGLYEEDGEHGENSVDNARIVELWERYARLPYDWVHSMEEMTCFLTAEEALTYGLVDVVMPERVGEPDTP